MNKFKKILDEAVSENKPKIQKHSNGSGYFISRKSKKGTEIFDPVMKSWVRSKAFVHLDDWKGVTFDSKSKAEKALK